MPQQTQQRVGREGSRWINQRPTATEVAEWFSSVPLHKGMKHQDYVDGVVIIQGTEKARDITGYRDDGGPIVMERQHVTFTPYMRVDTRVRYFWDLMEHMREWWVGTIEPVPLEGLREAQALGLPPGFFRFTGNGPDGKSATFVGCSMRVRVRHAESLAYHDVEQGITGEHVRRRRLEGLPIFDPPPATKIVPVASKWEVDPFSMMKAETGAVGRALGMAGMLVLGTGVATAEDMHELGTTVGASEIPATLPGPAVSDMSLPDVLRARVDEIVAELDQEHPELVMQVQAWSNQRGHGPVEELPEAELKALVKKLEKTLDEARRGPRAA